MGLIGNKGVGLIMTDMARAIAVLVANVALAYGFTTNAVADDMEARVSSSRVAVMELAKNLKGYLKAALDSPISIEEKLLTCKIGAPEATSQVIEESGFDVGRTSLRVRNLDNAPDSWERTVLEGFQVRKEAGEKISDLDHAEIINLGERRLFRYMKAIPVGEVCLMCHGTALNHDIVAALDKLYPEDMARGFEIGEIRGAFTVIQGIN